MIRDTAFQAASQSQRKSESFANWYNFVRSAFVAGFEAFGSAQIGMCSANVPTSEPSVPAEVSAPLKTGSIAICNQAVAETESDAISVVWSRSGKSAVRAAWRHA